MKLSDINTLQIEPTSYCNARCPHCGRFDDVGDLHPDLKLSNLDFDKFLENCQADRLTSLSQVILEGDKGDPIMHPSIEKFINFFYNLPTAPVINLMTNGGIRNKEWWYKLGQNFPNLRILFSIDGLEDTNHLYRVGVNYNRAIENAQAYIAGGGYAIWKFLVFKHNEHQINQIRTLSESMGFSALYYGPADRYRFNGLTQWPVKIDGQVSHYIEPASELINEKQHITYKEYKIKSKSVDHVNRLCPYLSRGNIYVTHQGHVLPCCIMHFDTENNYIGKDQLIELSGGLSNLSLVDYTLETILNNKFFNNGLIDSLSKSEDQWHFNCQRTCKDVINRNKLNLERK